MPGDEKMSIDERRKYLKLVATGGAPVRQGRAGRAERVAHRDGIGDRVASQEPAEAIARADSGPCTQRAAVAAKALRGGGGRCCPCGLGKPGLRVCGAPDSGVGADGAAVGPVGRAGSDARGGSSVAHN